jgi:hypothetical protein
MPDKRHVVRATGLPAALLISGLIWVAIIWVLMLWLS